MLRKLNLVPALFALTAVFVFADSSMARCVFRMSSGGPILVCSTCTCGEMKDAGVNWDRCSDFMVKPDEPKTSADKIIRYSDTKVTVHYADGTETPIASDESQKQFDYIVVFKPGTSKGVNPDLQERMRAFKPTVGHVSKERCDEIAKLLGVEVQESKSGTPQLTVAPGRVDPIKRPNN